MAATAPGDFTAGHVLTEEDMDALPGGIKGIAEGTGTSWTNSTITASDITVTSGTAPTLTLTLATTRKYRAVFTCRFAHSAGSVFGFCRFVEGGVDRHTTQFLPQTTNTTVTAMWVFTPASGSSVVYKVQGALVSASGTLSTVASSGTPMQFWIEDLGLA